ncbi:GerAB/ArcD/ProY family transporter [Paenibacillus filicis]|uniref:GerAB/ArcD/ProY family transporter n=1 Tax=Paenibacillus filicis TaxID=669464 RepID=A0ABU9DSH7_9BACL
MLSSKYFAYLFIISALINIINFVPRTLIDHRFDGALMSIAAAIVVGSAMMVLVTWSIQKIPGMGMPELYAKVFPAWLSRVLLGVNMCFWYLGGAVTLLSFVDITQRFISPDVPQTLILTGFLLIVCWSALKNSRTIVFALEAILLMNLPLIIYFFVKSVLNRHFSWDAVFSMLTHVWNAPNFSSMSGAIFIFTGYESVIILNRVLKPLPVKRLWLLSTLSLGVLLTTFLIPIAFHGTIGVGNHSYPWFSTADSIRIVYFVFERVLFMFYLIYLMMSLMNAIINWHIGVELFKSMFTPTGQSTYAHRGGVVLILVFAAVTYALREMDYFSFQQYGILFLQIRFIAEMLYVLIFVYAVRRYVQLCARQLSL